MPIYQYQCTACGRQYELKQGFDAPTRDVCPFCRGTAQRRFHSVTVIYKGSGFYTTDYKRTSISPAGDSANGATTPEHAEKPKEEAPVNTSTPSEA